MAEAPFPVVVRPCFEQDLQAVQFIYAHHVLHGTGSFETEPPDEAEMRRRWSHVVAQGWPYLAAASAADPARVVGFAYASPFRERAAYAGVFEDSVYVAPSLGGRGIGFQLLGSLLLELSALGARQVFALIGDSANKGSIALHEKCGFSHSGTLRDAGWKHGRAIDVVLMQRPLGLRSAGIGESENQG